MTATRHRLPVRKVSEQIGVELKDVYRAAERLSPHVHSTPMLTCSQMDNELSDGVTHFYFKGESFQKTGSFKFRGAYNAVAALIERGDKSTYVVAHSSGNHAQSVALAAKILHRKACVIVPYGCPVVKIKAAESYGAQVTRCGATIADRIAAADAILKNLDGVLVSSCTNPDIAAGQGTIALEMLEQALNLDAILVPIGSGSMISGISIVIKTLKPEIRIIGVQPSAADDAAQGLRTGKRVDVLVAPVTIADGLKTALGDIGWCTVSNLVDDILTVTEEEIQQATKLVWERMKIVVEPSASVGVAAARTGDFRRFGFRNVAIILSGGNVDMESLPWQ